MSTVALTDNTMLNLVSNGDCSGLSPDQRLMYYKARCDAAGLDPRTAPMQYINLQGKLVLYATKGATDQLAKKHGIALQIVDQKTEDGIRTVTVRAKAKDGSATDEIGCVSVKGLSGDRLCNAMMKAVTKAKRRAVLSLCGLGMLDETELETIPGAQPVENHPIDDREPEDKLNEVAAHFSEPEPPKEDAPRKNGKTISEPQWNRFLAVTDKAGMGPEERNWLINGFGYKKGSEMTMDDYKPICFLVETGSEIIDAAGDKGMSSRELWEAVSPYTDEVKKGKYKNLTWKLDGQQRVREILGLDDAPPEE